MRVERKIQSEESERERQSQRDRVRETESERESQRERVRQTRDRQTRVRETESERQSQRDRGPVKSLGAQRQARAPFRAQQISQEVVSGLAQMKPSAMLTEPCVEENPPPQQKLKNVVCQLKTFR